MLLSMTGYGKAECIIDNKKFVVEIRSLNSKQMDLSLRTTPILREKELDIRSLLTQRLVRGKVDCNIYQDTTTLVANTTYINQQLLTSYVDELTAFATEHNLQTDILAIAMRMPDVTRPTEINELTDEQWSVFQGCINQAIDRFNEFRLQEGQALQSMFTEKLDGITALLEQVEPLEGERINKIRNRIEDNLKLLSQESAQAIDRNRLEQEMIYYLEKLDITEEKIRLRNHIKYFFDTMNEGDDTEAATSTHITPSAMGVGKKLGFVAQEMGREINTLGSKSNQSEMQIIVVKMKDILEQIKEQVLNVL